MLGFNSVWTKNFQMFKLDLEKVEESEIKWPTFTGSSKKQESYRKTSTSVLLTMLKPLTVSVQFSHSVVSDSLWPHEPQDARPPCPSPAPWVHPNPCPLSRWCHPTISSSIILFSSCPQSLPASGTFPMSQLFASGGQSLEFQLQHQSFQWTPRTDLL